MNSRYFLLECRFEQLQQEILLALVGSVVEQRVDDRLHELGGLALRHLEDELGQVGGVGLQQVEQVLVVEQALVALLAQRLQPPQVARRVRPLRQFLVVRHHVLDTERNNLTISTNIV